MAGILPGHFAFGGGSGVMTALTDMPRRPLDVGIASLFLSQAVF
jgi:hypothetical protein